MRNGREHALEVGRVVLAVGVEVDGGGIALVTGELEPGPQRRAHAAAVLVRDDPRAVSAADRGRRVAGTVVDEDHVDRQTAGLARQPGEHLADGRLFVAGHDDGEAAPGRRGRPGPRGQQRAASRGRRRRHAEQG